MDDLHSKTVYTRNLLHALKVGAQLQLCTPCDENESRYPVTLIGWVPDKSIIVEPPPKFNWSLLIQRDQQYTIRLFSGTSAFAFLTRILRFLDHPYNHMHLSYPVEIHAAPVRKAERTKVGLAVELKVENTDLPIMADMVDASVLGARIRAMSNLGDVGDSIEVSFQIKTGGKEWPVSLSSIIRNKQLMNVNNDNSFPIYYGLEFQSVDDHQALIITSFLYAQMTHQK